MKTFLTSLRIRPIFSRNSLINLYFRFKKGLSLGKGVKFYGFPIIDIRKGGRIIIGQNVTLNSRNRGYHGLLCSPVKLFSDRYNSLIEIGDNTRVHGSCIHAMRKISIGKNCLIAANCNIIDSDGHEVDVEDVTTRINTEGKKKEVVIADNVWIGLNCIILPGSKIGNGSVIGAGSVVRGEIPPYSVAVGNPAIVVRKINYKTKSVG